MPQVNPDDLEKIINEAGLGSRSAKKLREANNPKAAEAKKPRGHGAPAQDLIIVDEI